MKYNYFRDRYYLHIFEDYRWIILPCENITNPILYTFSIYNIQTKNKDQDECKQSKNLKLFACI